MYFHVLTKQYNIICSLWFHLYVCKCIDKVLDSYAQIVISGDCSEYGIRGDGQREI